jgi:hypothetical protein
MVFHENRLARGRVNTGCWLIPDRSIAGRTIRRIEQGKQHLTAFEKGLGIVSYRPHQAIVELKCSELKRPYRISAALCYDATDLKLAADLRDQTDLLIVAANNKDIETFDNMGSALSYHMFQHLMIVNTGEFGGSLITAPYKTRYERVLTHNHGNDQAAISIVDIDLSDYQRMHEEHPKELKTPPAGLRRHLRR